MSEKERIGFSGQLRRFGVRSVDFVRVKGKQNMIIFIALIVLVAVFYALNPNFLKSSNILSMTQSLAPYAIMALGVTFVIATGGIDLSIGTVCIASAVVAGKLAENSAGKITAESMWIAIPIMIVVGTLFGLINGVLIAKLKIPAFIATLGTMMLARGLSALIVRAPNIFFPTGTWFNSVFSNANGVPTGLFWVLGLMLLCMYMMYKNKIGRYILSIGSNEEATRLSGMQGNPELDKIGRHEEALGRNAILGGFQGQRQWTDYKPNADFTEAILNSTFDWNGKREPLILATENDTLNGMAMLFGKLLTGRATVFADVRTYWSPEAVKRVTGWTPQGMAANGFMHLLNSGAAALDGTGRSSEYGEPMMKRWWEVTQEDQKAMLDATVWSPANRGYFRGGGFSSSYSTYGEMPVTLMRVNYVDGIGATLQLAEGYTVQLPEEVHKTLLDRTDPTWPSTWFAPRLTKTGAFSDVYGVMARWGANHGAFVYGHIGADLLTLASMLRMPVTLQNVTEEPFRPHSWYAFGTQDVEGADQRACAHYGPMYKNRG